MLKNLTSLPKLSVVNLVNKNSMDELTAALQAENFDIWLLDGRDIQDKQSLFKKTAEQLFTGVTPASWHGFAEQLEDKLSDSDSTHVAIIWSDIDHLLVRGLADFIAAIDILTRIARNSYEGDVTFCTFILGEGANFPAFSALER